MFPVPKFLGPDLLVGADALVLDAPATSQNHTVYWPTHVSGVSAGVREIN